MSIASLTGSIAFEPTMIFVAPCASTPVREVLDSPPALGPSTIPSPHTFAAPCVPPPSELTAGALSAFGIGAPTPAFEATNSL